jgi:dienelactone hydrolase
MPSLISRRQILFAAAAPLLLAKPSQIVLTAADGVKVFAWHYPAADASKPAILFFHQAGSNHAEYSLVAPRLNAIGYHCLAIDQRSGGKMWGTQNQTAKALGREADYLSALQDLEAALAWPKTQGLPAKSVVWGSSYSASLVFLLAAKHPDAVAAVLAFSPGEYLGEPHLVESNARSLHMPVFIDSAKDEAEIAVARTIATASHAVQFIPNIAGVHGSSTLREDRNPKGAPENWQAVEAFLKASVSSK